MNSFETNAHDERQFFSNGGKRVREKWVLEKWLEITGKKLGPIFEGEGPDFIVGNQKVEVVEVLQPDRKRQDEYKTALVEITKGGFPEPSEAGSLEDALAHGHDWVFKTIEKKEKKYGPTANDWVLLVYVNFSFWQSIGWDKLKSQLAATPRQFRRIDALTGDGQKVIELL